MTSCQRDGSPSVTASKEASKKVRQISHLGEVTHKPSEKCLIRSNVREISPLPGSGEEQAAAATVFALLCIQLGGGDEAEEGFKMLRPVLTSLLIDSSASMAARQSVSTRSVFQVEDFHSVASKLTSFLCLHQCARALGMCCYVSAAEDGEVSPASRHNTELGTPAAQRTA